jgi:single-strand DNA-binding protein
MNKVILIGRLGHNPSLRFTQQGASIVTFSLATSYRRDGVDEVEWHTCVAYEKTADLIHEYFKKGSQIGIEGRIKSRVRKTKEGNEVTDKDIIVERFDFIDRKEREEEAAPNQTE